MRSSHVKLAHAWFFHCRRVFRSPRSIVTPANSSASLASQRRCNKRVCALKRRVKVPHKPHLNGKGWGVGLPASLCCLPRQTAITCIYEDYAPKHLTSVFIDLEEMGGDAFTSGGKTARLLWSLLPHDLFVLFTN